MPDTSKLSKYLQTENIKDGEAIVFVDSGVITEKKFKEGDEPRPVLEMTVKWRGENKTYSPNKKSVKLLSAAWGTNTDKWVGKSASLTVVPSDSGRDMILAKPVVEQAE